ncbi:FAD/NAD(P)-binding domain-containing protein [Melanomma pulvis-pyrius CBS 109.77]|uniref:FAD/NAD(P)-binding domain-containing protein n=1 Tax=Melanomma pulvis-pyrius CBS 109.77 TaxID=1314802 RepID=A0A6A6X9J2_9PLEO|nr:FAD/NAD(P)-binding domain-containing protein [Melanomma pulvis-pyrius CBS 109.77]
MSTTITTPKIALIGSGPVSLTLASILHSYRIPFLLYEATSSIRTAGGSLDLHPLAGQQALREAGLWEAFVKYARPEADCLKLVDPKTGEVVWDENAKTGEEKKEEGEVNEGNHGRPEIDRARLVQILHESLAPGTVQFGKKLVRAEPSPASAEGRVKYDLHFADGSSETGIDILVGGDGTWSVVRRLLSNVKPHYSGVTVLETWINDTSLPENSWAVGYVGAGSMFAFGEGLAVQAQRQGDGSLRTYASLQVPEDFLESCGIDWEKKDAAREEYMGRYFAHVSPDLQRLVKESKDQATPRKLYELPVGWTWPTRSGVTLIGDAAHVMTPFAGVGVNVGMADAMVLAKEIKKVWEGEQGIDEALQAYEKDMFPRAEKNASKTARNKKLHFSAGGCQHMAEMLKKHAEQGK